MDRTIVENAGIEFFGIPSGKLRRYFSLKNVSDIFRVLTGFFAARRILKRERPALLFSKGGFVSVPPCAAAASLGIPVFSHESDFSPGLATRINTRFSVKIFLPYSESAAFFKDTSKIVISGNPVREEFALADAAKGRAFLGLVDSNSGLADKAQYSEGSNPKVLLVLGGSQGSKEINELIRAALPELTKHCIVVHQTGENNNLTTEGFRNEVSSAEFHRETKKKSNETPYFFDHYKPYAYFKDEIPHIIAAADLVICRAGAGTIWECKRLHKPMILIPLGWRDTAGKRVSRGDQVENARIFEESGAAVCFNSDSPEDLSALAVSLLNNSEKLLKIGEAKLKGIPDNINAIEVISQEIVKYLGEK